MTKSFPRAAPPASGRAVLQNSPASSTEDLLPTREALWLSQLLALALQPRAIARERPVRRELGIGRQPGHRFTGLDEMEIRPSSRRSKRPRAHQGCSFANWRAWANIRISRRKFALKPSSRAAVRFPSALYGASVPPQELMRTSRMSRPGHSCGSAGRPRVWP